MIRKFNETDLEYLQQQDFYASLELQYHQDVFADSAVMFEDENGTRKGVMYFLKHYTFEGQNEELNRIVPNIVTEDELCHAEFLTYAKKWCDDLASQFPEKKVCLATWINDEEHDELQFYMHHDFMEYSVAPCLKYELDKVGEPIELPKGMSITKLPMEAEEVDQYIKATGEANHGTYDSANSLWFINGGGDLSVYVLKDGDTIVSSASTWKITDERSAIENIFTNPEYRRKGMAKAVILYALSKIKEDGYQIATLSMLGRNRNAQRLYQSLGFELYYNQIELIYLPM